MHGTVGRLSFYIEGEATHGGKMLVKRIDVTALETHELIIKMIIHRIGSWERGFAFPPNWYLLKNDRRKTRLTIFRVYKNSSVGLKCLKCILRTF